MITRLLSALVPLTALLVLVACGGDGGPKKVPEVDRVAEAVTSRDTKALADLVAYQQVACVSASPDVTGAPKCRAGEAEGTLVDVVKSAQCQSSYLRVGDVPNALQHLVDPKPEVYAAFKAPDSWEQGDYAIVLTSSGQGRPVASELVIERGKIVMLDFGCGEAPEKRIEGIPKKSFVIGPVQASATPEGS